MKHAKRGIRTLRKVTSQISLRSADALIRNDTSRFLAHLSTTCSGRAIVTGHRPSVRPSICPSVNNFFKNLLLQNQKANLDKTWHECSLGEALQKLLKEFNSNKNSGCHGNKMAENGKNL